MDGKTIRIARGLAELTQTKLGQLVGVDPSTITRYETGNIRMSQRTYENILEVLSKRGIGKGEIRSISDIIQKQKYNQDGTCPYCHK